MNVLTTIRTAFVAAALLAACAVASNAQNPSHPRLILQKGDEVVLGRNIESDSRWSAIHDIILKESEKLLSQDDIVYELGVRKEMHLLGCETVQRVLFLAYSYRMTGDRRFLDRATRVAEGICGLDSWNPYHFLDVAELTVAAAFAYDWLYDDLSPELRTRLCESIRDKALETSITGGKGKKAYNLRWMDMTNNWSQICHGSLAIGAIAIYDEETELAEKILARSKEKMSIPLNAEYVPDGAYSQGIGYWGYGTALTAMYLDSMESFFGPDSVAELEATPGFMQTGRFFCQLLTNSLGSFSYCDNSTGENLPEQCIFWFYKKTGDPVLLHYQKQLVDIYTRPEQKDKLVASPYARHLPLMMVWGAGTGESLCADFASAKAPEGLFYIADGINPVCTMRSGWEKDDIWVGFKAGNPSAAHGHMDVGEFLLEWGGVKWSTDLGSDGYGAIARLKKGSLFKMDADALRWNGLLRYNNLSHSTLSFNGRHQVLETSSKIVSHSDKPTLMSATADITPAYSGQVESAVRTVSLKAGRTVVVEDRVKAQKGRDISVCWNLTTMADGFEYDRRTMTLTGTSEDGRTRTMKVGIKSNCGVKVERVAATDELKHPGFEKDVDGVYFIRVRFIVKGGRCGKLRCTFIPEE